MSEQVDILVLTHNALDVTKRFIELLYKNTENFRLHVLDNGSSDNTAEWLESALSEEENFNMISFNQNLGVINGRNTLFNSVKDSNSKYVCFLDNDQFVHSGWLEDHLSYMDQFDLVGVEAWWMDDNWMPKRVRARNGYFDYVGCGGMLIKTDVPRDIGMFDSNFNPAYFEDPDFCFRVFQAGYKIAWNDSAMITHLAHQTLGKDAQWMQKFQVSRNKFSQKWSLKDRPKILLKSK